MPSTPPLRPSSTPRQHAPQQPRAALATSQMGEMPRPPWLPSRPGCVQATRWGYRAVMRGLGGTECGPTRAKEAKAKADLAMMRMMRAAPAPEAVGTVARRLQAEAAAQHAGVREGDVPAGVSAAAAADTAAPPRASAARFAAASREAVDTEAGRLRAEEAAQHAGVREGDVPAGVSAAAAADTAAPQEQVPRASPGKRRRGQSAAPKGDASNASSSAEDGTPPEEKQRRVKIMAEEIRGGEAKEKLQKQRMPSPPSSQQLEYPATNGLPDPAQEPRDELAIATLHPYHHAHRRPMRSQCPRQMPSQCPRHFRAGQEAGPHGSGTVMYCGCCAGTCHLCPPSDVTPDDPPGCPPESAC